MGKEKMNQKNRHPTRRPNKNFETEKGAKDISVQVAPVKKRRRIMKKKKNLSKRNKYLHLVLAKAQINNSVDKKQSIDSEGVSEKSNIKSVIKKKKLRKINESDDQFILKKRKLIEDADDEKEVESDTSLEHDVDLSSEIGNKKSRKGTKMNSNDPDEIKKQCDARKNEMLARLGGSQFRFLNEKLYTTSSEEAFKFFTNDPSLYKVYHKGYQIQMSKWPDKPMDIIVKEIRAGSKELVVADFGCGDASLAKTVPNTVHSFDLVALNDNVTVCDMAHVPLKDRSVDIAVFCLSLMGTNFVEYILEANRVLKFNGILKIAEIKSRFKSIEKFTRVIQKLGFKLLKKDVSHKMFVYLNLKKCGGFNKKRIPRMKLEPCVYKKR